MRVMGVDHGEKRIGLAISDSTGSLARPLGVIHHVSRKADAQMVGEQAAANGAELIVVGESFDEEGHPNAAGRRAEKFAEALRSSTLIPVAMWDESMSTQDARTVRIALGIGKKRRAAPVDANAAAMILQSFLDARRPALS